jgi:ATP-dependent 26S proteasome regulatory subunit
MADAPSPSFIDHTRKLVAARHSLVFVVTFEEERLERLVDSLARSAFSQPVAFFTWSVTEGLRTMEEEIPDTEDPVAALNAVIAYPKAALFLFKDLHRHYDDPLTVRTMRDVYRACHSTYKTVFVSGPELNIPGECRKEFATVDLPLPSLTELDRVFTEVCSAFKGVAVELGDARDDVLRGTLGLTEDEARFAFTKVLLGRRQVGAEIIDRLYEEKRDIVRKEGILEYVPPRIRLDQIGGLTVLKNWLRQRKRFFSHEAESYGLDPPKGLLITGVSGCGKSMAVQAISAYWVMPMLRLDMNRVYGGVAGTPERSLEIAIRTAEAVSPCVLWIDEIETALVGTRGGGETGLATRIFSSFLTWMQEKEHIVFVAATANEIDRLPPELMRKGRFDEIFFVDLPGEKDRSEIFAVHLAKRNKDPADFDLVSLSKSTPGFNGAEIEQVVLSAMYTSFDQNREVTMNDLYRSLGRMVPLSTTMSERIKEIKRWADTRAVKANG